MTPRHLPISVWYTLSLIAYLGRVHPAANHFVAWFDEPYVISK